MLIYLDIMLTLPIFCDYVVKQALQFDPTLRAEIEYDLKLFERSKKEKLLGKCTIVYCIVLYCMLFIYTVYILYTALYSKDTYIHCTILSKNYYCRQHEYSYCIHIITLLLYSCSERAVNVDQKVPPPQPASALHRQEASLSLSRPAAASLAQHCQALAAEVLRRPGQSWSDSV